MHEKKVDALSKKLRVNFEKKNKISLSSHTSNTTRDFAYKTSLKKIDFSSLNEILSIDTEERVAMVEPSVTMESLVKATLKYQLIPLVVPEFKSITIGGAIMGAALESSSHLFGQFNDTCIEYELLTASGQKIIASKDVNSDLFYGVSGSYGTIAFLTAIKIKLIPAKKYVKLNYQRFSNISKLLDFFGKKSQAHFLEGGAFRSDLFLGVAGELTDSKESNHHTQNHYFSKWFTSHTHKIATQFETFQETMPLEQYLFRYDRGAFWIGYYLLSLPILFRLIFRRPLKITNSFLQKKITYKVPFFFRFFLGALFSSKRLYKIWHKLAADIRQKYLVIQDFYTPLSEVDAFFQFVFKKTAIFPIWFALIKGTQTPQYCSPHYGNFDFLVDVGVYGIPENTNDVPKIVSDLEKENLRLQGKKMLYSFNYYDEKTFTKVFAGTPYQQLREKFDGEKTLLSLYNKVCL